MSCFGYVCALTCAILVIFMLRIGYNYDATAVLQFDRRVTSMRPCDFHASERSRMQVASLLYNYCKSALGIFQR